MSTERDNYRGTFIGIPLPDHLYLTWAWQFMSALEYGRFPELKNNNTPPHLTIYYMGGINRDCLLRVNDSVLQNYSLLKNTKLRVDGLKIIGREKQALVVGMRSDGDQIKNFRAVLEKDLPDFVAKNLRLLPHFTITELRTRRSIERARNLVLKAKNGHFNNKPFPINAVQIYSKDENNQTISILSVQI